MTNNNKFYNTKEYFNNHVKRHHDLDKNITNEDLLHYKDPISLQNYKNITLDDQKYLVKINKQIYDARLLFNLIIKDAIPKIPHTRRGMSVNQEAKVLSKIYNYQPNKAKRFFETIIKNFFK